MNSTAKIKLYISLLIFMIILLIAYDNRNLFIQLITDNKIANQTPTLQGDATEYYKLAVDTRFPCFSTVRPPGILCYGRIILYFFGYLSPESRAEITPQESLHNNLLLRKSGILVSLACIVCIFVLALSIGGKLPALISALLYSTNLWSTMYSVGFLRVDLVAFFHLVIVACFCSLIKPRTLSGTQYLLIYGLIALAGTFAILTRLSSLILVFFFFFAYLILKSLKYRKLFRKEFRYWLSSLLLCIALSSPYLVYNKINTGYISAPMNSHAKFWRNHEFAGQPDFPSRKEVLLNSYTGSSITPFQYVFGLHSIPEIFWRYLKGYYLGFTHYLNRLYVFVFFTTPLPLHFLIYAVPLGMLGCLIPCYRLTKKRPKSFKQLINTYGFLSIQKLFVLISAFICLFPFAFIIPLSVVLTEEVPCILPGVEPRFTMPILPFSFIFVGLSVKSVIDLVVYFYQTKLKTNQ